MLDLLQSYAPGRGVLRRSARNGAGAGRLPLAGLRCAWDRKAQHHRASPHTRQAELKLMISTCSGCHARIHRTRAVMSSAPPLLLEFWREQHPEGMSRVRSILSGVALSRPVRLFNRSGLLRGTLERRLLNWSLLGRKRRPSTPCSAWPSAPFAPPRSCDDLHRSSSCGQLRGFGNLLVRFDRGLDLLMQLLKALESRRHGT